jgi:O-antigen/teichoic acid export membrane protein
MANEVISARAMGGQMNIPLRDKVRSGLLWSAAQSWGMRLSSLLLFMIVARVLAPDQLGLFAAAMVVLSLFGMLSEQGLSEAVVQRSDITQEQMNAVFWVNVLVALLLVGIVWLAAPSLAQFMKIPELTAILRVASFSMPLSAASFGQVAMRRRMFSYRWLATTTLASTLVGIAVAAILLYVGFGVWSLVAQTLVGTSVATALMWSRPIWRLSRQVDFRGIRPLMAYGSSRLGTYLLDFANTRYIEIFLASTMGPAALAVYTVGLKLQQSLMQMFSSTILDVAHSGFSRLAGDRPGLIAAYNRSITVTATLVVPIFIGVAAVAPSLTVVLFGAKWASSAEVMRWMALLGAVQVLQFYNGTVYNAIGRPLIGLQFMVVKVILTFGALGMAREGGMTGLLHAYIFSQLATTPLSFYVVRRLVGVSLTELARRIWPMLVASCSLALASASMQAWLLSRQSPVLLVLLAAASAGAIAYLLVLQLIAPHVVRDTIHLLRPRRAIPEAGSAAP